MIVTFVKQKRSSLQYRLDSGRDLNTLALIIDEFEAGRVNRRHLADRFNARKLNPKETDFGSLRMTIERQFPVNWDVQIHFGLRF